MFKSQTSNVCIDIGGTNTRVALIENNEITKLRKFSTNKDPFENFKEISDLIRNWQFTAIGISTAGPVLANGIYGQLPNLPKYQGFNIYRAFEQYNVPIVIEKDANCSAYAVHQCEDISTLYITISTGIGGGLVVNNELYKGCSNNALELHKIQTRDGVSLEAVCSGPGIYQTALNAGLDVSDPAGVFKLAETNTTARKIIDNAAVVLANAIVNVEAILNPSTIVFGGSVVQNNVNYFNLIRSKIERKIGTSTNIKLAIDSESSALLGINKILRREHEVI